LFDPNVAYLLLILGTLLAVLALLSPGTGLLELGALFAFVVAGWSISNLQVNYWALGVLLLGIFPFLLAVRRSGKPVYLVVSALSTVIGSTFLFRGESWLPAVNPFLALVVSALITTFYGMVVWKVIEAEKTRPAHDLNTLIGEVGEAKTGIHQEGTVQVAGELWTARSAQPIPDGAKVRVVGREGFILDVEPA
jgi:membrane-bound serine protease (ClpP class)